MGVLDDWRHCPRCASAVTHDTGRVECEACGFVHWAHSSPAVSAFVTDSDGRVLLGRRAHEPDVGLWDALGGFLEEAEHPLDGLRREVLEETGLDAAPGAFVGAFMDRYGDEEGAVPVLNLVWEVAVSGDGRPADDVTELRWFERDQLPADGEMAFRWLAPGLPSGSPGGGVGPSDAARGGRRPSTHRRAGDPALRLGEGEGEASNETPGKVLHTRIPLGREVGRRPSGGGFLPHEPE